MALTYNQLIDRVEATLQDSANTVYSANSDIAYGLQDSLRELSKYRPHVELDIYTVESRTGTATSTSASHLVDTTEVQFVAGDVGKTVYNTTDNTWAQITAYTSTSDVTLNADIMASGESYKIFNGNCRNAKQIDIEDSLDDCNAIKEVQFPAGTPRNWSLIGNILELDLLSDPSDTGESDADKTVYVYVERNHYVSNLSDTAAAVNLLAGYAAGSTSIILDALQTSGTIKAGQEFTIDKVRGIYRVTADATIATNAATISFFPGLWDAAVDNAVVTFKASTLTPQLETLVADLAAAYAAINKPMTAMNAFAAEDFWTNISTGITEASTQLLEANSALTSGLDLIAGKRTEAITAIGLATTALAQAVTDTASGRALAITNKTTATTAIGSAATAIALGVTALASGASLIVDQRTPSLNSLDDMTAQINQAIADTASARALFNTVNVGAPETHYLQSANTELGSAMGLLNQVKGYFTDVATVPGSYRQQAITNLQLAGADVANAKAYLDVDVAANSQYLKDAGQEVQNAMGKLSEARALLSLDEAATVYQNQAATSLKTAEGHLSQSAGYIRRFNAKAAYNKVVQYYQVWGERRLAMVSQRLQSLQHGPRILTRHSSE